MQDEIACIEKTLKRRNTQLRQVESEIRSAHKELLLAKNQKKLVIFSFDFFFLTH
jgi:hypothetical protein